MKKINIVVLLITSALVVNAQNWSKSRPVSGFSEIQVSHGIDVYLTQDGKESLQLEAKGLEEEEVISEVKGGVLILRIDRKGGMMNWGRNNGVKARVSFRMLSRLKASGGSDIYSQGQLHLQDFVVEASGGSDVKLDIKASRLSIKAGGGSDVNLMGSVAYLEATANGGSDLDAKSLTADKVMVRSSGGSDAYVYATKEISAEASGGSDVYYRGPAKAVNIHKSGGSDILRRN
ncbi:MAG: head GIN domain-containing protein [Siphonobacter sp.]